MQQLNELRKGNLLEDQVGNIIKVDGIGKKGFSSSDFVGSKYSLRNEFQTFPIKLTKQWLEEYGFEEKKTKHKDYNVFTLPNATDNKKSFEVWINKSTDKIEYTVNNKPTNIILTEYVHNLQNAFHICSGYELKHPEYDKIIVKERSLRATPGMMSIVSRF